MIAFVTGAGGFIGTAVVRQLRARGDSVRALVRDRPRAAVLAALGCELIDGDLADVARLTDAMDGADAVFHLAGIYRVGIAAAQRPAMYAANVTGTEHALDAALAAGVRRIVYVSTINAFGDTGGRVVDETYERPRPYRYVSYYDETKHLGHLAAQARQRDGAPIVIVQPGGVYGPGDPSQLGGEIRRAMADRLPSITFGSLGLNLVHVDDVATGIGLAHAKGQIGKSYVLGGELVRMTDAIRRAARAAGARPPRMATPTWLVRVAAPLLSGRFGLAANLREVISASDGATYWATDAKARRDLGYAPRGLDEGLGDLAASLGR